MSVKPKLSNLLKKNPEKIEKILRALKVFVGTISGAAYLNDKPELAFWILIAGGGIDFVLSIFFGE